MQLPRDSDDCAPRGRIPRACQQALALLLTMHDAFQAAGRRDVAVCMRVVASLSSWMDLGKLIHKPKHETELC